jgi:hypothetical protein
MQKYIKIIFGVFVVLAISVVFVVLKLRPKMEIPFFFGYLDPLVFFILAKIMRKSIQFFVTKFQERRRKKTSISKFQIFVLFLWDNWHKYVNLIEYKFGEKFPIFFFRICRLSDKYILWTSKLSKSPNFFKRCFYHFLLRLAIYPVYIGLFVDFYNQSWHYLFWGLVISYFIYFVKGILIARWGEMYAVWWFKKNASPQEFEDFIKSL